MTTPGARAAERVEAYARLVRRLDAAVDREAEWWRVIERLCLMDALHLREALDDLDAIDRRPR